MTTNQISPNLKDYRDSKEEAIAKQVLEWVITENEPGFYNLVIKTCNAEEGTSFSDASVYLQHIKEVRDAVYKRNKGGFPSCGLVLMKDLLNVSSLKEFVAVGVEAIEKDTESCQQSFLTLLEFLREKRRHAEAIQKIITTFSSTNGSQYTNIKVAFAHHLFSQLVPGKMFVVDDAEQVPDECGCGCKARICKGNTSLGSNTTWHGRADILLNQAIAVAVLKKSSVNDKESEDVDTDEDEPERKSRKVDSCDGCAKVETAKKHDIILLEQRVMKQILAETIANGFAQVNIDNKLSNFLIPTFGATSEHVTICLYDSENDYLLHIKDELQLWGPGEISDQLNISTIVIIWLFLNFTLFTQKKLDTIIDLDKSGLHEKLEGHLECYRKAETGGNIVSPASDAWMWKYLRPKTKIRKNRV